jgi:hypothetical protein
MGRIKAGERSHTEITEITEKKYGGEMNYGFHGWGDNKNHG